MDMQKNSTMLLGGVLSVGALAAGLYSYFAFDKMDTMCKVMFLREVRTKAIRILAHKKKKVKCIKK
jgi:hypothetical protein